MTAAAHANPAAALLTALRLDLADSLQIVTALRGLGVNTQTTAELAEAVDALDRILNRAIGRADDEIAARRATPGPTSTLRTHPGGFGGAGIVGRPLSRLTMGAGDAAAAADARSPGHAAFWTPLVSPAPAPMSIAERIAAQEAYCTRAGVPNFTPSDGRCYGCGRQVFDLRDGTTHITSCPHCHKSFAD